MREESEKSVKNLRLGTSLFLRSFIHFSRQELVLFSVFTRNDQFLVFHSSVPIFGNIANVFPVINRASQENDFLLCYVRTCQNLAEMSINLRSRV